MTASENALSAAGEKTPGNERWLDRVSNMALRRPLWFALAALLGIVLLPVAVWMDLSTLSNQVLTQQASELNRVISEFRGYYARNIVSRINENSGMAHPVHNYESIAGGIPIPATMSIELGTLLGGEGDNFTYRFVSDMPFSGRAQHELDAFESNALAELRKSGGKDRLFETISGSLLDREVRIAVPVIMGQACVDCHNSHPESPKRDWKVGDVRGIQSISVSQPISANLFSFKYLLAYLIGAGFIGMTFTLLQWRQAKRFAALNGELEEANSFLAAISMKISKYLSPQVYKSIFSGARDAVIATERKRLTIFFSDIEDFTISTERLQPEELTALLNEYFTEMTRIAESHGGTVDKFIGDALLVFFGDPESKGAEADARACLDMAVAMQKRMAEINRDWRNRGVEKPFRTRMGINTGFCNVGNFGSADRMDYTIIGAEANLAARLQTIAEPGGIVLSYETYALVRDKVEAVPLEPITLKGISRQVIPYAVKPSEDVASAVQEDFAERIATMVREHLKPDAASQLDEINIENAFRAAIEELRRSRP